ncbi:MAG: replication factor C large subunit [Theionarchaea archaeon]|nr:replication factor C large subunit [Theionarchaea archaeon]
MHMYTETYRPSQLSEIVGQPSALKELVSWFNTWPNQKKVAILYGRAGVGKTSAVLALAQEVNADLVELNASDQRNKDVILRKVGLAATTSTLHGGGRRIILLDEADNVYGREDKGGYQAISEIIDITTNPIILIANEYWEIPDSIRKKAKMIEFRALLPASIAKVLHRIVNAENLNIPENVIQEISRNAKGDLRAALNDLESLTEIDYYNPRDLRPSIFSGLASLFRDQSVHVRKEFWNIDMEPRETLLWIAENTPLVYDTADTARAFYYISRADVFLGRVMRRQYYRFWAYASDLMTSGVSVSRMNRYHFQRFQKPSHFLDLVRSRKDRNMKQAIHKKIGPKCHCSMDESSEYIRLLRSLEKDAVRAAELSLFFDFNKDEIFYIFKKGEKILKALGAIQKEVPRERETPRIAEEEKNTGSAQRQPRIEQRKLFEY